MACVEDALQLVPDGAVPTQQRRKQRPGEGNGSLPTDEKGTLGLAGAHAPVLRGALARPLSWCELPDSLH